MVTEQIPDPKEISALRFAASPDPETHASNEAASPSSQPDRQPKKHQQNTQDSAYQNYLFGGAGSAEHPAWSDTASGRAMIRLISRGIVGATFFVVGSRMAASQMSGYNQETWQWDRSKPLQAIAKGIDVTLGKGIQKTVEGFAGLKHGFGSPTAKAIGKRAVTFRESRHFNGEQGRSYGSDIVNFTFDFAMASIGDAGTRSIIQGIDPNIKKTWKVNDQGEMAAKGEKWHFVPGEWLKAVGKSTWRVMSKNQGEDWAAAIPYAFQMKFQRQFLSNVFSKRWDAHKLVFDHGWNGGAWKINQQGKIVGDMQLAGAIDLHARFTGYNWYTLMFREGYDAIGNAFTKWKDDGFAMHAPKLPEHFNPITAPIDGALRAARYVTKSFIKANMYMNPAVVPFWLMRVPQSKWRGKFFVEEGMTEFNPDTAKRSNLWEKGGVDPVAFSNYEHYSTKTGFDRFEKGFSKYILNPFGWVSFKAGKKAADAAEWIHTKGVTPKSSWIQNILIGDQKSGNFEQDLRFGGRKFAHEIVDASFSYTPYMYAKQELGLRVDDGAGKGEPGKMDLAIYKFMDDVASFKFNSVPDDLKKMWKLGSNFEREIKAREGGDADAQEIAKANAGKKPHTTVHASTTQHVDPANLSREQQPAANEAQYDATDDRSWAKMVAGSDIHPSRIHATNQTRH